LAVLSASACGIVTTILLMVSKGPAHGPRQPLTHP
jgi:hypothetical protein